MAKFLHSLWLKMEMFLLTNNISFEQLQLGSDLYLPCSQNLTHCILVDSSTGIVGWVQLSF